MKVLSLYLLIPYAVLILVAFFVFYNAVKRPGLCWLNKVTVITLIVFTGIIFLPLLKVKLFFLPHILPDGLLLMLPKTLMLTISVVLLLFYIISAVKSSLITPLFWAIVSCMSLVKIRREKKRRLALETAS